MKGEVSMGAGESEVGVADHGQELRSEGPGRSWKRDSHEGWR